MKIGIAGFSAENLREFFNQFDVDKSGELDLKNWLVLFLSNNSIINERRNIPISGRNNENRPQVQPPNYQKFKVICQKKIFRTRWNKRNYRKNKK